MAFRDELPYISDMSLDERRLVDARALKVLDPYNYCRQASFRLMDDLLEDGFEAKMLRCQGLRTDAIDADARWINVGAQIHWVHYVVKLGEEVIDLTRRQFFPVSAYPFIQSYAACETEWDAISAVK